VLHISIWEIEASSGGLSGDGTEFWTPCDSVDPPIGGYGVRLIRFCVHLCLPVGVRRNFFRRAKTTFCLSVSAFRLLTMQR